MNLENGKRIKRRLQGGNLHLMNLLRSVLPLSQESSEEIGKIDTKFEPEMTEENRTQLYTGWEKLVHTAMPLIKGEIFYIK